MNDKVTPINHTELLDLIEQNKDNLQEFAFELDKYEPGFLDPTHEKALIGLYKTQIGWYKEAINEFEELNKEFTSTLPFIFIAYCYNKLEDVNNYNIYIEKYNQKYNEIKGSQILKEDLIEDSFKKIHQYFKDVNEYKTGSSKIISFSMFRELGEFDKCIKNKNYKEAINEIFNLLNNKQLKNYYLAYRALIYTYLKLKDYNNALSYFYKFNNLCKNSNNEHIELYYKFSKKKEIEINNQILRSHNSNYKKELNEGIQLITLKYENAINYLDNNEFSNALNEFIEAVGLSPEFYLHHLNVGYCYYRLDDYRNAEKYYNKAYKLNSSDEFFQKFYELHVMFDINYNKYTYQDFLLEINSYKKLVRITSNSYLYQDFLNEIKELIEVKPQSQVLNDTYNYFVNLKVEEEENFAQFNELLSKASMYLKEKKYRLAKENCLEAYNIYLNEDLMEFMMYVHKNYNDI